MLQGTSSAYFDNFFNHQKNNYEHILAYIKLTLYKFNIANDLKLS